MQVRQGGAGEIRRNTRAHRRPVKVKTGGAPFASRRTIPIRGCDAMLWGSARAVPDPGDFCSRGKGHPPWGCGTHRSKSRGPAKGRAALRKTLFSPGRWRPCAQRRRREHPHRMVDGATRTGDRRFRTSDLADTGCVSGPASRRVLPADPWELRPGGGPLRRLPGPRRVPHVRAEPARAAGLLGGYHRKRTAQDAAIGRSAHELGRSSRPLHDTPVGHGTPMNDHTRHDARRIRTATDGGSDHRPAERGRSR
jgi:hypothetical protein